MSTSTIVCVHETRAQDFPGLKLLLLSLAEHCPGTSIDLTYVPVDGTFEEWAAVLPDVSLTATEASWLGWNVKPQRLLELLDAGWHEVIWMDSDVILTADPRPLWVEAPEVMVAAAESPSRRSGSAWETLGWGLKVGRELPHAVNSCVVRITPAHRGLIEAWAEMLQFLPYQEAQRQEWDERPDYFMGDQDALTALLGAVRFADVPIKLLRNGKDVIQLASPATYSVQQRLRNRQRLAPIVHAQRIKPWRFMEIPSLRKDPADYYNLIHSEVSPYSHVAREYRDRLGEPTPWMDVRSQAGRTLRAVSKGHVNYQGIPQAALHRVIGGAYRPRFLGGT